MGSRERKLLRKQINQKLNYMTNKESKENGFLTSSQIITERQDAYSTIMKSLRKGDNRRIPTDFPFAVDKNALPHISIAKMNRILKNVNEILQDSDAIDKIINIHSFRTATPYYTNPKLTVDRGKVMNYSQHLGTLLHTPRYIDFLKAHPECGSTGKSQISEQQSAKEVSSSSLSYRTENSTSVEPEDKPLERYDLKAETNDKCEQDTLSRSRSLSRFSKVSTINISKSDEYDDTFTIKTPASVSIKASVHSSRTSDEEDNNNDNSNDEVRATVEQFLKDSMSESPFRENLIVAEDDCHTENIYKNSESKSSVTQGQEGSTRNGSDAEGVELTVDESGKEFEDSQCKGLENQTDFRQNDQYIEGTVFDRQSEHFQGSVLEEQDGLTEIGKGDKAIIEVQAYSPHENVGRPEPEGHHEIEGIIKVNGNIVEIVGNFLKDSTIGKDEFKIIMEYYESVCKYRTSNLGYVTSYGTYLEKNNHIYFTRFKQILDDYSISNLTNDDTVQIRDLLQFYSSKSETEASSVEKPTELISAVKCQNNDEPTNEERSAEEINKSKINTELLSTVERQNNYEPTNGEEPTDEMNKNIAETVKRVFLKPDESWESFFDQHDVNVVTENDIKDESEADVNELSENHEAKDTEKAADTTVDHESDISDSEEFWFSFHELFRSSIGEFNQRDLDDLKQLVSEYDVNAKSLSPTSVEANNDDDDFTEAFNRLFRNSIGTLNEEHLNTINSLVDKYDNRLDEEGIRNEAEEETMEENENETIAPFYKLFRRSIETISKTDLAKVREVVGSSQTKDNRSNSAVDQMNNAEEDMNDEEEKELMMAFRNLFRNSIGSIGEGDISKIMTMINEHETSIKNNDDPQKSD